jgi:PAS domain S-box-containing protein
LFAEHASDIMVWAGPDGRVLYVSPSVQRYGYEPDEIIGSTGMELFHPEDRPRLVENTSALLRGEFQEGVNRRHRLATRRGDWVWVEGSPRPIFDSEGRPLGFLNVFRDVTEQHRLETAARRQQDLFGVVFEHSAIGKILLDMDGRIIRVNRSLCQTLDYAPDELIGRRDDDFAHPDEIGQFAEQFGSATRGELQSYQVERRYRTRSGSWKWFSLTVSVARDADGGAPRAIVAELQDLTERRAADQAVAASEARYRLLADNATDVILRCDRTGMIEFASPSVRRWGYEPDAVVGQSLFEFLHPDERAETQAWFADLVAGKISAPDQQLEVQVRAGNGDWIWLQSNPAPIKDDAGGVIGMVAMLRDITEAREARERLAESEARYRLLADSVHDLIVRYDRQGVIEYISPSVRQFGYEPADLIGRNAAEFEDREFALQTQVELASYAAGGPLPDGKPNETCARRADGAWVWLEGTSSAIRDKSGAFVGVVTVLRDVTARRAMEDELRRKRVEAEAATVAKSEFVANMSHEIRTPLTGMLGFVGLLEGLEGLPPTAAKYVDRIATSGQALLSVVNDILDFSKLDADRLELDPHPFDPAALVTETLGLVGAEAARKGLSVCKEVQGVMPAAVLADRSRVRQVLLNLLTNAIKFTDNGRVTVKARHLDENGGRLSIAVTDTGVGIPPDRQNRLFERFSQVDGSTTRQYGGTGLGLAISKGLIDKMGGEIGFESREGQGSTFWFTVDAPLAELEEAPAAPMQPEPDDGLTAARILVVDDVAMNRELVRTMLSPFGYELVEAASGAEAVAAAMAGSFDLILMDLQMPGMDGLAATRAIRQACDLNHDAPIVALSANALPVHLAECAQAGMDDHIAKPIAPAELLTKIARWTAPSESSSKAGAETA